MGRQLDIGLGAQIATLLLRIADSGPVGEVRRELLRLPPLVANVHVNSIYTGAAGARFAVPTSLVRSTDDIVRIERVEHPR